MKKYYLLDNVGTVKYTVNYHDGVKTHRDGSKFYDIALFSNKKKRDRFVSGLEKEGYRPKGCGA